MRILFCALEGGDVNKSDFQIKSVVPLEFVKSQSHPPSYTIKSERLNDQALRAP